VIEGEKSRFFCMVTDVRLDTTNPQVLADPPDEEEDLMRQVLHGTTTYGTVCLRPLLMTDKDDAPTARGERTTPGEDDSNPLLGRSVRLRRRM
jgi:hypothetical protein